MGPLRAIGEFFRKIGVSIGRAREKRVPRESGEKRAGNDGEIAFLEFVENSLDGCAFRSNVIASDGKGCAEIDFLLLFGGNLFSVEIKNWYGTVIERGGDFFAVKADRYTGELHHRSLSSPFRQVYRQSRIFAHNFPGVKLNPIVLFFSVDSLDLENPDAYPGIRYFTDVESLERYIRSFPSPSSEQAEKAENALRSSESLDVISATDFAGSLYYCKIDPASLEFDTDKGKIAADEIARLDVTHRFARDDIEILLPGGETRRVREENRKIRVLSYCPGKGYAARGEYSLCRISRVTLGRVNRVKK